jgi:hypothetical protein
MELSPSPRHYAEFIYGLRHCLIDRDGRVIASHVPQGNGQGMAAAPAMVPCSVSWSLACRRRRCASVPNTSYARSTDARRASQARMIARHGHPSQVGLLRFFGYKTSKINKRTTELRKAKSVTRVVALA